MPNRQLASDYVGIEWQSGWSGTGDSFCKHCVPATKEKEVWCGAK